MRVNFSRNLAVSTFFRIFSFVCSYLPRRPHIVFIGSGGYDNYKDNVRAAFELCSSDLKALDYHCYWISSSEEVLDIIKSKGLLAIEKQTLSAVSIFLTAKIIVSGETAPPTIFSVESYSAIHICLSHGFGPRTTVVSDGKIFKTNDSVRRALNRFDYYLFPNKFLACQLGALMYGMPDKKFFIAQQPRLSCNYVPASNDILDLDSSKTNIFYCPTWRQSGATPLDLIRETILINDLNSLLAESNCVLWISGHPISAQNLRNLADSHIRFIDSKVQDPSLLVRFFDLIVSDYSSLITDAVFWKKPLLLYCPDLDYYQFEYGLNINLKQDFSESIFISEFTKIFSHIDRRGGDNHRAYYEKFCESDSNFSSSFLRLIRNISKY